MIKADICPKDQCTGCGLCAARCPVHCITMKEGLLGHLFPVIDHSRCTNCGLCRRGCPVLHPVEKRYPKACYAAWAKNEEEYRSSTSGGAAAVLSRHILRLGGVVYGCAMLPGVEVKHVRIDKEEGLHLLKGSKYVQSKIVEALPQLRKDVQGHRPVLFVGTPCQVAAVRNMFPKGTPDNLYLVDIICHGVPSLKMLRRHVKRMAGTTTDAIVGFRNQTGYCMTITVGGKTLYENNLWTERYADLYYNAFIDGFSYRESCHTCAYACPERCSDVTIGDFWGLGKEQPADEMPSHPDGCSVMLSSTDKGIRLMAAVRGEMNLFERPIEEAVKGNDQLRAPYRASTRVKLYLLVQRFVSWPSCYYLLMADVILKPYIYKKLSQFKFFRRWKASK